MRLSYYLLCIIFIIVFSCIRNPDAPIFESDSEISINNSILVNDGLSLTTIDLINKNESLLLTTNTGLLIYGFDYCRSTSTLYALLHNRQNSDSLKTIIARANKDGSYTTLYAFATRSDGEGFYTFLNINSSPLGRYLALKGVFYEGGDLRIYDTFSNSFIQFDRRAYTEYVDFLVWDLNDESAYAKSHDYLVKYNVVTKELEMLPTPNIRDYLSEEELLKQGYLGNRVDYELLTGSKRFDYVNWAPNGMSFMYQTYENPNILYLFTLNDSSISNIHDEDFNDNKIRNYCIVWDESIQYDLNHPEFSDDDEIVQFDESILDTIQPLNDSLFYNIEQSHSISFMHPNWNNRSYSCDRYFFYNNISDEKFHVAELDYLFWLYALDMTPGFWFLLLRYEDNFEMSKDSLITTYGNFVEDYYEDYLYFKAIQCPNIIASSKRYYDQLVYRDYRFQKVFLDYLEDDNFEILRDSTHAILYNEDINLVDTYLDTLNCSELTEGRRLVIFSKLMHNTFLNYYGKTIDRDLDFIKDELLIDELTYDWLYKALFKKNRFITDNYIRNKEYVIP